MWTMGSTYDIRQVRQFVDTVKVFREKYVTFIEEHKAEFQRYTDELLKCLFADITPTDMQAQTNLKSLTAVLSPGTLSKIIPTDLDLPANGGADFPPPKSASSDAPVASTATAAPAASVAEVLAPGAPAFVPSLHLPLHAAPAGAGRQKVALPSLTGDAWAWKADALALDGAGPTPGGAGSSAGTDAGSASGSGSSEPARSRPSESTVEVAPYDEEYIKQELESWAEMDPRVAVSATAVAAAALFAETFDASAPAIAFPESFESPEQPPPAPPQQQQQQPTPPRQQQQQQPAADLATVPGRPAAAYACPRCLKQFRTAAQRDVHERIHTGERPFRCGECAKAFRSGQSLAAHRLVHKEDRPYQCELCGRAFRQSSNLASHRLIHSGVRPHKCAVCGKGFIKSSDLRRHAKVHNRVYV